MNKKYFKAIRILFFSLLILSGLMSALQPSSSSASSSHSLVYIIPIEDNIERGLQAFLERSFQEAVDAGADHILLEMDTFGGAVDAASGIGKLIRDSSIPTTNFVIGDAISAGAYIALNADKIVMSPGSTMGAATVIDGSGTAADAKSMSFWIEAMREAALLNDRDPLYAAAMVDVHIEIEGVTEQGTPLTFGANQAYEYGYTEAVLGSRAEVLQFLDLGEANLVEVETSLAEKVARFVTHPILVPILLSIGSLGLVLELYSPGFGIPGALGISALLLFFFGHMIAGFAGWESLLLFVVGIILIAIELFMPGFGIFGILGLAAVIGSLSLASYDIVSGLKSVAIAILVTVVVMAILGKYLDSRGFWRKIVLEEDLSSAEGNIAFQRKNELFGQTGVTLTKLRPAGSVKIGNQKYDVVSEGGFIDVHQAVQVVHVEGTRIMVSKLEEEEKN